MDGAAKVGGDAPLLLETCEEGVLRLTLNRPAQRNALSIGLMSALGEALDRAAADNECRVVTIAGAGPAFCAGHDLREFRALDGNNRREAYQRIFAQCSALMLQIGHLAKPVIAEVHGTATRRRLPAGCDLRSGGCRGGRPLRDTGRGYRPLLLDPDGGADPRRRAQAGNGDAADRRTDRRRDRQGDRPRQPGRAPAPAA